MDSDLGFPKCTSIAAGKRNGAPAFVAQTLDIPRFYHGHQAVLRIRDEREGLGNARLHDPGRYRRQRLNDRSVGVCVNA